MRPNPLVVFLMSGVFSLSCDNSRSGGVAEPNPKSDDLLAAPDAEGNTDAAISDSSTDGGQETAAADSETPSGQAQVTQEEGPSAVCVALDSAPDPYVGNSTLAMFDQLDHILDVDFDKTGTGAMPQILVEVQSDEYEHLGFTVNLESSDPTSKLIWAGNPESGFGLRVDCESWDGCFADIIVEFNEPRAAVGFDYPGSVQAIWTNETGGVIWDSGEVEGHGMNFMGLHAHEPIKRLRLHRDWVNELSGLHFEDCKLAPL